MIYLYSIIEGFFFTDFFSHSLYVIKNSCNTVPDISKIFLNNYSTKGENHGRGLSIVQNICNNYSNVFFNVKIQDNFFLSELIINTVD